MQNDLNSAVARGHFSLADREKLNGINAVLGENLGSARGAKHADQKKVKAALKDIEKLEDASVFADADRVKLDRDRKVLKDVLDGKYPVYRGYSRGNH
jgi:hypothetical protein